MALPITIIEKENILKSYPKERLTEELAQPTGNFPLFLVASRLKEVEEMEKAAQADMAKQQMSQQAGSVYERMVTGQPETPSQGSFAQNRPMSPGVPNVPSQIAAQPVPQPPQQPTQMPMAVAANGGYAGNLPTVRMQGDPRDWVPTTPRDRVAIAEMAQRGGLPRGGSFETGGAMTGYDPAKHGLAALLAKKAQRAKMLAALGQPLVTSYSPDSPYGTGAGFVKKYADDGGYVNNLPTVRMQGIELPAILGGPEQYQDYVASIKEYGLSNPALLGLAERELGEAAADQMNLMADSSLINARRANFEQMMGIVLDDAQSEAALAGTPPLWASPDREGPSIRDRFGGVLSGILGGGDQTDLSAIREQGVSDPRFQAVTEQRDVSDFAGLEGGVGGDDEELPAITAAPDTDVGARARAILGSSLERKFDPATGTWKIIDDPTVEGGSSLDVGALLSGGRVWDGEKWVIQGVGEAANIEAEKAAIRNAKTAVVDGEPTPDQIQAAEDLAITQAARTKSWAEQLTAPPASVPVPVSEDGERAPRPSEIVVKKPTVQTGGAERDLLDSLSGFSADQTTRINSLNNIQDFRSPEQISAGAKKLVTDLQVPVTTLINNSRETIEGMEARSKASIAKIEGVMEKAKDFAEGGKLPEKLQGQYINELLMTTGAALLKHPTWHQAGEAILEGGIKVKDKYREDYAKSINTLLANTTALETMRIELANTTDTASIALAKSAYEFNTGAIAAGQEYEKTAYAANAKRAEIENAMVMGNAQSMSAFAQLYAAVNGKPDADERQLKNMMGTKFEELLAADRAAVTEEDRRAARAAMDEWFYSVNGEYSVSQYRTNTWFKEIILPKERAAATTYTAQGTPIRHRDAYQTAVQDAGDAWEAASQSDRNHKGVTKTFKLLYPDVRIESGKGLELLRNIDRTDFERAYLMANKGLKIETDWAGHFAADYGDTRKFQLEPVPVED